MHTTRNHINFINACNKCGIPKDRRIRTRYWGDPNGLDFSDEQIITITAILSRIPNNSDRAIKINHMLQEEFDRINELIKLMPADIQKNVEDMYNKRAKLIREEFEGLILNAPNIDRANIIFNLIIDGEYELAENYSKTNEKRNLDRYINNIPVTNSLFKCIITNYDQIDENIVKKLQKFIVDVYNDAHEYCLTDENREVLDKFIDNLANILGPIINNEVPTETANHIIDIIIDATKGVMTYAKHDESIKESIDSIINFARKSVKRPNNVIEKIASIMSEHVNSMFYKRISIVLPYLGNFTESFQVEKIFEFINSNEYEYMNEPYLETVCDAIANSRNKNVAEMVIKTIKELYGKYKYRCNKLPDDTIDTIIGPILCYESQIALNIYTKDELDYLIVIFRKLIASYYELNVFCTEDSKYKECYNNPFITWYIENLPSSIEREKQQEENNRCNESCIEADKIKARMIYNFIAKIMETLYGIKDTKNRTKKLKIISELLSSHKVEELYDIKNFLATINGIVSAKTLNQCLVISNAYRRQEVFDNYNLPKKDKNGLLQYIDRVLKSDTDIPSITDVIELFTNHKEDVFLGTQPGKLKDGAVEQENHIIIAIGDLRLFQASKYFSDTYDSLILEHDKAGHQDKQLTNDTKLACPRGNYVLCLKRHKITQ